MEDGRTHGWAAAGLAWMCLAGCSDEHANVEGATGGIESLSGSSGAELTGSTTDDRDYPKFDIPPIDPGPVVQADSIPPPIVGGTLWIDTEARAILAADTDRDAVYVVSLDDDGTAPRATVDLGEGAAPTRVLTTADGDGYVLNRGHGTVVRFQLFDGLSAAPISVCPTPTGMAADADGSLWVSCSGGSLVHVVDDVAQTRAILAGVELRDVVPGRGAADPMQLSTFIEAELLTLDEDFAVGRVDTPRTWWANSGPFGPGYLMEEVQDVDFDLRLVPNTARRTRRDERGVYMLHQGAATNQPLAGVQYYGDGSCVSRQASMLSWWDDDGTTGSVLFSGLGTVFDAAFSPERSYAVAVGYGGDGSPWVAFPWLDGSPTVVPDFCNPDVGVAIPTEGTAVVFETDSVFWVQGREPAVLLRYDIEATDQSEPARTVGLSDVSAADTGHRLFHAVTGSSLSCVSCHPEGRQDGQVWTFADDKARRTQSLITPLADTAPYHWDAEFLDLESLDTEVRERRMNGDVVHAEHKAALTRWLFSLEPPATAAAQTEAEAASIERGAQAFEGQGCNACHAGAPLTNNATVAVADRPAMQVPSLVGVRWRAPYLHDGSADNLAAAVRAMYPAQVDGETIEMIDPLTLLDLLAYLQTL